MFTIVWLSLLAYSSLVTSQGLSPNNANNFQGTKSIFILAGQSNMSGRGGVTNTTWDGFVPPECHASPRVLRLNAELNWEEAHEPLHRDIDVGKSCGVGPGMAFANSVLERERGIAEIGLVPCAVGGTNITEWRRGSSLYNQLMLRAQAALRNGGWIIRAILWYQGESDTLNYEDAKMYKRRLYKFFDDVRSDLQSPLLPIIQVQYN